MSLSYLIEFPAIAALFFQDQTVKVAEARDLQSELERLKVENTELKKTVEESTGVEVARKKAEARVETLEAKVLMRPISKDRIFNVFILDGGHDTGESYAEGE
jgi:hypothetical protein